MTTVDQYFAHYADFHHSPQNKGYHYVGIPLITYALLNLLYQIPHIEVGRVSIDCALLFMVSVLIFYFTLDWRLAMAMALLTSPVYVLAAYTHWGFGVGAFVVGWVLQFMGHHVEGKKPAFLINGLHILIGPLWIASHLLHKLGLWSPRTTTA